MKKITALVLLLNLVGFNCHANSTKIPKLEEIAYAMQGVADWQITHFRDLYSNKNQPHNIEDWTNGALYVGMLEWIKITQDSRYENWLKSVAEKRNWQLGSRTYMADDHAVYLLMNYQLWPLWR